MRHWGLLGRSITGLLAVVAMNSAAAVTVTKTVDPPGLVSVDGCGTFCNIIQLGSADFTAADFPPSAVITDVDVSITWFKTDGSCPSPNTGLSFHEETSFRIDGPSGINVILAQLNTWDGDVDIAAVTTVFDQAAAAPPATPPGTPVSGSFQPNNGNLNNYIGLPAVSSWSLRPGDNGPGDPLCIDSYSVTVTAESPVLINEVDADTVVIDTLEFVELYDGGIGNTPLVGLVLVLYNGASDDSYAAFDLDGFATDANGYFVLGNAAVANVGSVFADNTLQNGADAVALYVGNDIDFPFATPVTASNLVDAFVYDTNDGDDAGLLGTLLLAGQAQINEDGNGNKDFESNQRCPDGAGGARVTANYTQALPTPGSENCVAPMADLSITKTDGVAFAVPGASVTYTITASNAGPDAALGAMVSDNFPAACTSASWTCVGAGGGSCSATGMGNINDAVDLPVGGSVTYTATCAIASSAGGNLVNTATISGLDPDPNPANNSATDTDTYFPMANVTISKDDGVTSVVPGTSTTYTIIASNAGPSDSSGSLIDIFPAACTSVSWTCVSAGGSFCLASGMGNINHLVTLTAGGSVTYMATCSTSPAATGSLSNTATLNVVGAPLVNATDTNSFTPQADLVVTKDNGVSNATPGGSVTWTIGVSNAGPSDAPGSSVTDNFPAACTAVTWTCTGAGGGSCTAAGSGNIADTVNLPAGGSVSYSATCAIDVAANGTLVNTAAAAVGPGVTELNPANNSATDSDTLVPDHDLAISKDDGVASAVPGTSVTWTIIASNATGPSNAVGAMVSDSFPAFCTSVTWTCVGAGGGTCTAAGSGNMSEAVNLPVGATATFSATCAIDAAATGTLDNTATIAGAAGSTDPVAANNSATDTDTLTPQADLVVTKDDGVSNATPGGTVTWAIGVSNAGPSDAPNSSVTDSFPAFCTTVNWTCVGSGGGTCPANGSGNIAATVNLPAGGSVVFGATCAIDVAATGTLDNTASAAVGPGVTELDPANNSATDSDTLMPDHDLAITKTDGVTSAIPGQSVTYTIVASNAGPSDAVGATVSDSFPAACTSVSWTCVGAGGGTCAAGGSGNIADTIDLPVGGTATYSATCAIDPAATGMLDNTATIAVAAGSTDPNAGNNSATDSDTLTPQADLSITKVDQGVPVPTLIGSSFSYLLTVSNAGPSTATGVMVSDSLPSTLSYVSNDCGASFAAPTLSWNIGTMGPATSVSCTINVTVATLGSISNTATISSATPDPTPGNNAATNTLTGAQAVDVAISLTSDAGAGLAVGDSYTYTVTGTNLGVGLAGGLDFTLELSGKVSFVSSSCGAVLSGNTLSWSVATLADGASTSCDITVVVVLAGDIQASANVTTATFDPNLANNTAELAVAVAAIPIPALDRFGLLLLMLLSAGLGGVMLGRVRSA